MAAQLVSTAPPPAHTLHVSRPADELLFVPDLAAPVVTEVPPQAAGDSWVLRAEALAWLRELTVG